MSGKFEPGYYKLTEQHIVDELAKEGFTFKRINEPPGSVYESHKNPADLLLVFAHGSADVRVGEVVYHCVVGDRLLIPGCVEHSAQIGPEGCVYMMRALPSRGD